MVSTTKLSSRRPFVWLWFALFLAQAALPLAAWGQTTGQIQWIRQFGSTASDDARSIAVDASGIYVAGRTDGALPGQTNAGGLDAFVRKYDVSSNALWTRQFGTASYDEALGIAVNASGVYVAGTTLDTLPGQASAGVYDAFVRKYDASGNEIWTRQFGTASGDEALGIAVDASGVYVAGRFGGDEAAGFSDAFVRKYDASGNELWTRQFGTTSFDLALGIAVDASGVYVAGVTFGALAGPSAGFGDAFVRKYDASGNEVWTRQFGSASSDFAIGIAVDASGIYVAGQTSGTLPFQTSAGDQDAFVRKYDAIGNEVWTRQFGTTSAESALGIAVDASGIYVAGWTEGTFPGQISSCCFFVRKYDTSGNALWTRQFGSSPGNAASDIAVDASGIYAAGYAGGTFPGQTSAGGVDAFVVKLLEVPITLVSIDIKPGSFPNSINLGSGGTVPVAILSSASFDATTVDPTTVTLAGASVALRGKGTPNASVQDVNGDGRLDLVVHVSTEALQLTEGDTLAILTGRTYSDQPIQGSDTIRVVP